MLPPILGSAQRQRLPPIPNELLRLSFLGALVRLVTALAAKAETQRFSMSSPLPPPQDNRRKIPAGRYPGHPTFKSRRSFRDRGRAQGGTTLDSGYKHTLRFQITTARTVAAARYTMELGMVGRRRQSCRLELGDGDVKEVLGVPETEGR